MAIPTKAYIFIGVLIASWFIYHEITSLTEDLQAEKGKSSLLSAANKALTDDLKTKSLINLERDQKNRAITKQNEKLKNDLKNLKKTPEQIRCDRVPTPDGYSDRMLNYGTN